MKVIEPYLQIETVMMLLAFILVSFVAVFAGLSTASADFSKGGVTSVPPTSKQNYHSDSFPDVLSKIEQSNSVTEVFCVAEEVWLAYLCFKRLSHLTNIAHSDTGDS